MYRNQLSPPLFPAAWACDYGEDRYGLWMAFSLKGVRLALRWIPPGTFMMGSPDTETGRWESEALHPVTLSLGFWMAETTVTQALWQALMGNNPSHFIEDQLPVECVDYEDAQSFITQLNIELLPLQAGTCFRLPSEAEWEYACRAGTTTAFNFGETLNLEQVNYRGTWYDYIHWADAALQKTATVKCYSCNAWGLYEMHGNVWEWCQDYWTEQLAAGAVLDPKGSATGSGYVVRGGSWDFIGRDARSACRYWYYPVKRDSFIGFRLALSLKPNQL